MGRKSDGYENYVADDLESSLDLLSEESSIEEEIILTKDKLKRLRETLIDRKKDFSKLYNRSKRNFPNGIFSVYVDAINSAKTIIGDKAKFKLPGHKPLITAKNDDDNGMHVNHDDVVKKKRKSCSVSKAGYKENNVKRTIIKSIQSRKLNEAKGKLNLLRKNDYGKDQKAMPIWNKDEPDKMIILSADKSSEKVIKIYKPVLTPNPFEDFMLRL